MQDADTPALLIPGSCQERGYGIAAMKLVEALMVSDEADIVDVQIAYHLNAGVDFVIAIDHDSHDGTTEILESYARQGYLRRLPASGEVREMEWRTRMARLAATEHGADWVFSADADEFWIPRLGTIKEVLAAVPPRFGVVGGVICHFVPRPGGEQSFAERMTVRLTQQAPINDPTSPWRQSPKAAHRADPDVLVLHAGYGLESDRLKPLPGWYPFDVFHFPCRSVEQWARKTARRGHADADKPLGQYVKGLQAQGEGHIEDAYNALVVDDVTLEQGLAAGSLVVDTRLRDVVLAVDTQAPSVITVIPPASDRGTSTLSGFPVDGVQGPTVDGASLQEAILVRLRRRVDDASVRVGNLENRIRNSGSAIARLGFRRRFGR